MSIRNDLIGDDPSVVRSVQEIKAQGRRQRTLVGETFRSQATGNRYLVICLSGKDRVRVEALDGGRFGDATYTFDLESLLSMERVPHGS